jgi:hypothetical protein
VLCIAVVILVVLKKCTCFPFSILGTVFICVCVCVCVYVCRESKVLLLSSVVSTVRVSLKNSLEISDCFRYSGLVRVV